MVGLSALVNIQPLCRMFIRICCPYSGSKTESIILESGYLVLSLSWAVLAQIQMGNY